MNCLAFVLVLATAVSGSTISYVVPTSPNAPLSAFPLPWKSYPSAYASSIEKPAYVNDDYYNSLPFWYADEARPKFVVPSYDGLPKTVFAENDEAPLRTVSSSSYYANNAPLRKVVVPVPEISVTNKPKFAIIDDTEASSFGPSITTRRRKFHSHHKPYYFVKTAASDYDTTEPAAYYAKTVVIADAEPTPVPTSRYSRYNPPAYYDAIPKLPKTIFVETNYDAAPLK